MVIAQAPVRVSFGGGGTDLAAYYTAHGGFVLSTAVSQYCSVVANAVADGSVVIHSADYRCTEHWASLDDLTVAEPLILPRAVLASFRDRGLLQSGITLQLAADVPPGTGLGSSSAMTVALIAALTAVTGRRLTRPEIAAWACTVEIEQLGLPIGKQDQYASACGGLNTITFTADQTMVRPVAVAAPILAELEERTLLFTTGLTRHSASILADQQRDTAAKPTVAGGLHMIKELAHAMEAALTGGDLDGFGRLLDRAWQVKRGLSARISNDAIDRWYDLARGAGALGGKVTGAGGGGFLMLFCQRGAEANVRDLLGAAGLAELSFRIDRQGVRLVDRPSEELARRLRFPIEVG